MDRDTKLRRGELARALTAAGFPISDGTLSNMACRYRAALKAVKLIKPDAKPEPLPEFGPRFKKFGRTPIYTWGDALDWAQGRSEEFVSRPGQPTAEEVVRREELKNVTLDELGL
jgi:hypothetical protein